MSGHEMKYIQQAFESGWVTQGGPNVDAFEIETRRFLGGSVSCAAVSSGTAAIHLALRILGVGTGDVVICQSLSFVASVNPILYLGAIPVLVGSEPETWNISPKHLENAIIDCLQKGEKPKAIVAVCLYGMPYQIDEVAAIAEKYNIPIIEDSAEALGSKYKGKYCGTFGDISILSYNGNKIITSSGGGMLISKNKEYVEKARFLATQARDQAPHYEHSQLGYNYRMSNVSAGIGLGQMEVLEDRVAQKRQIHKIYSDIFCNDTQIQLFENPNKEFDSNFWMNIVIIEDANLKSEMESVFSYNNIETRPFWKPMHLQPLYKNYSYFGDELSNKLYEKGLCLPSGTGMDIEAIQRIKDCLISFL